MALRVRDRDDVWERAGPGGRARERAGRGPKRGAVPDKALVLSR